MMDDRMGHIALVDYAEWKRKVEEAFKQGLLAGAREMRERAAKKVRELWDARHRKECVEESVVLCDGHDCENVEDIIFSVLALPDASEGEIK